MITEEFIEQIFITHRGDKTTADHAMTTVAAVRSVLLLVSHQYNIPELKANADTMIPEFIKRCTDEAISK